VVTVNDMLDEHVKLTVDCLDRLYLHRYLGQPQVGGQVIQFPNHRGYPVPFPACLQQVGDAFRSRAASFAEATHIPVGAAEGRRPQHRGASLLASLEGKLLPQARRLENLAIFAPGTQLPEITPLDVPIRPVAAERYLPTGDSGTDIEPTAEALDVLDLVRVRLARYGPAVSLALLAAVDQLGDYVDQLGMTLNRWSAAPRGVSLEHDETRSPPRAVRCPGRRPPAKNRPGRWDQPLPAALALAMNTDDRRRAGHPAAARGPHGAAARPAPSPRPSPGRQAPAHHGG